VRNPGLRVRALLGEPEGTMSRRHPGEILVINWTKWDLSDLDPLLLHITPSTIVIRI